jgi:O-antigen/teichoic acid export membrane protein
MSPLILISTITNFIGMQILYANGKERVVAQSLFFGAIVSIVMNVILIPLYSYNGAAVSVLCAELAVLIYQITNVCLTKSNLGFMFNMRVLNILIANILYFLVISLFKVNVGIDDPLQLLILSIAVSIVSYPFILLLLKDSLLLSIKEKLTR